MHPPGTPKPSKNQSCWSKNGFLEGFGVPDGCKSILNVKCLHKSHMAELFGPRVFCFSWVKKKVLSGLFGHFCADLKHNFNMIFSSYVGTLFRYEPWLSISHRMGLVSKDLANQKCSKSIELYDGKNLVIYLLLKQFT